MQLAATRGGKEKRCSGRPQLAEINTGFSRASRSPALRRLAELAPQASAREQHSADRSRACELKQRALFLNRANAACGGGDRRKPKRRASAPGGCRSRNSANCETAERQKTAIEQPSANNYFLSILPRHYAASGLLNLQTTLTKSHNPCHSGCEVAVERRYR